MAIPPITYSPGWSLTTLVFLFYMVGFTPSIQGDYRENPHMRPDPSLAPTNTLKSMTSPPEDLKLGRVNTTLRHKSEDLVSRYRGNIRELHVFSSYPVLRPPAENNLLCMTCLNAKYYGCLVDGKIHWL